jgi:cell division protein FtsN
VTAVLAVVAVVRWRRDPFPAPGTGDRDVPAMTSRREGALPAPVSPSPAPSEPAGEPVAARGPAPEGGPFTLQVGSYRTRSKAASVLRDAEAGSGLRGEIVPAGPDDDRWYRILLGSFASAEEARAQGETLVRGRVLDEARVRPAPTP